MFKKRSLFIMIFLLVISLTAGAINTPWLHTEGKYIKDPAGNNVVLRGISFISLYVTAARIGPRTSYYPHTEETDEQKANLKAMIDLMTGENTQDWWARALRLAVYPTQIDEDPGWNNASGRARYNELITTAVDYATSRGVYVILDWHYVDNYGDKVDETQAFWDWAVPLYKSYSNVLFEIYNEPIDEVDIHDPALRTYSWTTWKNVLAQPIVNRIRSYHGARNPILVGGPAWCQQMSGANADPISGGDIIYVSHIYPYHWDNPGSGKQPGDLSFYLGDLPKNYPVFFTEWGFQDGGNVPCDAVNEDNYAAGMKNFLNAGGHSWTFWCFDPWWEPKIWSDWQYTGLLGNSLPSTGGYQGRFMKDFLYETRNSNLPQTGSSPTPTRTPTPTLTPTRTPTRTPTVTATLRGDVNGDGQVTIVDALMIAQYSAGLNPAGFIPANADTNCSATIDINDAMITARYAAGLITSLPC